MYFKYICITCIRYIYFILDFNNNNVYYMTSDNVFSELLTSLVTFFDKTLYSPRVTSRKVKIPFQRLPPS